MHHRWRSDRRAHAQHGTGELPLGPPRFWAQRLRTAIDICLSSRFPIALYWGPQYLMLYNDDLLPMVGANKHPWALGRPAQEVIGMPGEDGLALIRRVRRLRPSLGGQTPALALTAYARSEDRIAALKVGLQMHLAKPIEPTDLLATIATLVGGYNSD
ncbi:MAG TPA: response regulator [Polyangiaceae bacterium]